jgi:hypothetical protein
MEDNKTYLIKIRDLIDKCYGDVMVLCGVGHDAVSGFSDSEVSTITQIYKKEGWSKTFNDLYYVPHENLKVEIYSTLSGFSRERQETYYLIILSDFLTTLKSTERYFKNLKLALSATIDRLGIDMKSNVYDEVEVPVILDIYFVCDQMFAVIDSILFLIAPIISRYLPINDTNYDKMISELIVWYPEQAQLLFSEELKKVKELPVSIPGAKLKWRGGLTDLSELVWVLAKTGYIISSETSKPATIDELNSELSTLLGLEKLDVDGLVSKRINNTNKPVDRKMFVDTLRALIETHPAWKD